MMTPTLFDRKFLDDFFQDSFFDNRDTRKPEKKLYGKKSQDIMKTDIVETKDAYEMRTELPGFKKEDIKLSLKDGYLTISAERNEENEIPGRFICKERYAGTCSRSFYIGEEIEEDDIRACFKRGILQLILPKKKEEPVNDEPKYIAIEG